MKKYISVFNIITSSSIYKILALFTIMCVVEVGVYVYQVNIMLERYEQHKDSIDMEFGEVVYEAENEYGQLDIQKVIVTIEDMFSISHTMKIFAVTFVGICICLSLTGCNFRSRQDYTWRRLQVSEKTVFFIQTCYNSLILMLFLAVQVVIAYGLCNYYISVVPEGITNQSIFLAFYRSGFLHSILPLEANIKWIANIVTMMALGIASAMFSYQQRRNKISVHMILMVAVTLLFFSSSELMTREKNVLMCWSIGMIEICLWKILQKKESVYEG